MDQNIYSDGTPAKLDGVTQSTNANKYSLVAWNSSGSNTGGPVDAMQFLYNATKDWTNIDPITYEYKDKEYQGTTVTDTSYTSFVLDDGIATITALDGITTVTIGTKAEPLRVRMPIYAYKNEQEYGEVADKTENNTYLYDNLDDGETAPYCYWTLSSDTDDSSFAWDVVYSGYVSSSLVDFGDGCGARPVINLKI